VRWAICEDKIPESQVLARFSVGETRVVPAQDFCVSETSSGWVGQVVLSMYLAVTRRLLVITELHT
jgi:hypothetical protein